MMLVVIFGCRSYVLIYFRLLFVE